MFRLIGWLLLILLIAGGVWGYFFLVDAGAFRTLEARAVGTCKTVSGPGVVGVEDLTVDPETGIVYLSGSDRWAFFKGAPVPGAITAYDIASGATPVNLTPDADAGFQPHGISLHRGADGKKTLFVVNHGNNKHTIEIFDVEPGKLTHRRTVEGAALLSPNDVVGVGHDQFYVTNDHGNAPGWRRTLEDYGRFKESAVFYYDGQNFSQALSNIGGSNGINVSADGKTIYLSAGSEQTLYTYDRNLETGALTQRSATIVPGFADNIELLNDGSLLVGVHSKILELLGHFQDATKLAPSHIVRLAANGNGGYTVETVYLNLGEQISAASVGAGFNKHLLIGPIFQPGIQDCDWQAMP